MVKGLVPYESIENRIYLIRGQKVMIDIHLAELYLVPTKALNQAVKRNIKRFPRDFMFQLTENEAGKFRSQVVTANQADGSRSQFVTLKRGHNIKYLPYVFTEQGVAMLSSVLNSERAIQVNIQIMRTFTKIRKLLATHSDLRRKIAALERKYDGQFNIVFKAINEIMKMPDKTVKNVGFLK